MSQYAAEAAESKDSPPGGEHPALVWALTVAYERDERERGQDYAYRRLEGQLSRLRHRGELSADEARHVSFRVRYADLLDRFDVEAVRRHKRLLAFAAGPDVHRGVEPGDYAVPVVTRLEGGNSHAFYRVAGFNDPDLTDHRVLHWVKGTRERLVPRRQIAGIFGRIAACPPEGASFLFRRLIGACPVCGRRVTRTGARLADVGPWCWQHRPASADRTRGGRA